MPTKHGKNVQYWDVDSIRVSYVLSIVIKYLRKLAYKETKILGTTSWLRHVVEETTYFMTEKRRRRRRRRKY